MSKKTVPDKTLSVARYLPILLALVHIVAAFLLTWLLPLPVIVAPVFRGFGFLLVMIGFLLGLAALIPFRRSRMAVRSKRSAPQLITSGIYGLTRNPVYLGFTFMLAGLSLNAGSYWGIILLPVMVILFDKLIIEQEESHLMQTFGDGYQKYKSKVRRWL